MPAASPEAGAALQRRVRLIGGLVAAALALFGVMAYSGAISVTAVADGAGVMLLITTVVFFAWLLLSGGWTPEERRRLYVIALFFLAAALFWSLFEQAGSTLNLFGDRDTRTSVFGWSFPSSWFQSMNSMFIWMLAPVFAWIWIAARIARAVDTGQVFVRPAERRRRVRGPGRRRRNWPRAACRSARCGSRSCTCCTPAASSA